MTDQPRDAEWPKLSGSTKFRKKPIIVDAWQFTFEMKNRVYNDLCAIRQDVYPSVDAGGAPVLNIQTLEGVMTAAIGDWIVRGAVGELYPCKPAAFAASFEPVEQGTPAPATLAEDEVQVAAIEAVATALDKATENALASHGRFDTREMARVAIAAYQPLMTGATEKWIARMKGLVESVRDMEPVGNILAANEALDRLEELKVLKSRQPAPTREQVAQLRKSIALANEVTSKATYRHGDKEYAIYAVNMRQLDTALNAADAILALWEK